MGFVSRIFSNNLALSDQKAWNPLLWNLLGNKNASGVAVDQFSALNYSAVFCAINLISSVCSMLPLKLIREKKGRKIPAVEKSLYRVLHTRWNKLMTAQVGREVLLAHILGWGNGYAEKVFNGQGDLVELWPIPPNRCRPFMDEEGNLKYQINVGNAQVFLGRDKVLHIPGLGFDGFMGYSVITMARQSIGLSLALEEFGASFFGSGTHPGAVVSHPGKLSEPGSKNLRASLTEKYSGLGQAHRLMLLEEGMKLEKLGVNPNDSQFLESRVLQVSEMARWFNLPVHKLKEMSKSSFNNIAEEQISFITESILPWCIRLETNFDMQLLSEKDQAAGYYSKHNLEGQMRGDAKSRMEFYKGLWSIGAINDDEIRAKEDLDPIPGGLGQTFYISANVKPLGTSLTEDTNNDNQPPNPDEQTDEPLAEQEGKRRGNGLSL